MSVALAGLGALGGGAAAGAATLGAGFWGSVISGVATGFMQSQAKKDEEKSIVAEEKRRAAQYKGLGAATQYWKQDTAEAGQVSKEIASASRVGQRTDQVGTRGRTPRPNGIGTRYAQDASRKAATKPRYQYDKDEARMKLV